MHAESTSFGSHSHGRESEWEAERELIISRWRSLMGADPFHNPNLADTYWAPEAFAFPPRVDYPWRTAAEVSRRDSG